MTTTKSATQEDTMKKPATEPTFDVRFTAQAKHVRRILDAAKAARKSLDKLDFDTAQAIVGALMAAVRLNARCSNMDGTVDHESEHLRDLVKWAARRDV
jgi:acyl-CoA reductase-like NAD-dependent aldehyde dehydrogenase